MPSNGLFHNLILRWFLLRQQGLTLSPTDLCRDCPEHQEEVERSLQAILAVGGRTAGKARLGQNGGAGVESATQAFATLPPAADPSPVSRLLLRWQEQREQGIDLSADELCRDCPEHHEEVSRRLRALRDFCALLGAVELPGAPSPAAPMPAVPGYEILELLGEGGMGLVYKARQTKLDRIVALKVLRDGGLARADALARFRTEAEAIARLQHPNIVQIFEVGEHNGQPFLAMEFCSGGGLDRKLDGTPLPPHEAAALVETLAGAVEAAHRARVVHRDLKPANVLLQEEFTTNHTNNTNQDKKDNQEPDSASIRVIRVIRGSSLIPKISDFGLARKLDEEGQTQTGAVMGTPSYMAPEQARAEAAVGPAADVYALGAILYELLTGRPPFRGSTTFETMQLLLTEEPAAPRRLNPKVPRDLQAICLTCLEKLPARRYTTAADLAEDLRRFSAGETIQARPVGSLERLWRWCRRNPAVAALLGAVAAALFLGTAVATLYAVEAERQRREAVTKKEEAETQKTRAEELLTEKDRALQRTQSALKTAQLLRVELVGATDPQAAFLLLRDETVWPTPERDFAWRVYNRWCQRTSEQTGFERATLRGHKEAAQAAIVHSATWAWACPRFSVGDCTLALWVAGSKSTAGVECVRFSPDGKMLASASTDHTIKLWGAQSRQEWATLRGHADMVLSVCFSPDGKTLASGSADRTIKLWDIVTRRELASLKGHAHWVRSVCFSPDGKTLASASHDRTIKLWDVATRREQASLEGHKDRVSAVCFSPDGKTLATGCEGDGTVQLWDAQTGQKRGSPMVHYKAWSVVFSPDGKTIVSASVDGRIKLWNAVTGEEQAYLRGQTGSVFSRKGPTTGVSFVAIHAVCFSPDGKTLASATNEEGIALWDVETWQVRASLKGHQDFVNSVDFSPDGKTLASASDDGTIKLWNGLPGQERATLSGHTEAAHSVCFSPDGKTLASSSRDKTIKLWDAQTGQERATFKCPTAGVSSVCFSPNGKTLASASSDKTMKLWDARSGEILATLKGHSHHVNSVCFSPDGKILASASYDCTVKLWDIKSGAVLATLKGHTAAVDCVCFSPNGTALASAAVDQTVKLWDVRSGQVLATLTGHTAEVESVCFSPDGKILGSASYDCMVKLWDVQSGAVLATLKGHTDKVHSVCFSPDGKALASGSWDRTIILWDTSTRQPCATFKGHTDAVGSVCFAPDGKTLASGSLDRTIKLWDVASARREWRPAPRR